MHVALLMKSIFSAHSNLFFPPNTWEELAAFPGKDNEQKGEAGTARKAAFGGCEVMIHTLLTTRASR